MNKYRLLIPINKKSDIRGYWIDKNRLYKDNLSLKEYNSIDFNSLDKIKQNLRQICLFYSYNNIGNIYYSKNKINQLKNKIIYRIGKGNFRGLKRSIKELLSKFEGLTVYKQKEGYLLEAYY